MSLSDITITRLNRMVSNGTYAHAYLVVGPYSASPNLVAGRLIQLIHCQIKTACGTCTPCRLIGSDQFPDLIRLVPSEGTTLKVSDIRTLENRIQYGPSQSQYLTVHVPNAHRLTTGASNALLKTLESPPDGVIFCLSTTVEASILPTIVSRCLPLRCAKAAHSSHPTALRLAQEMDVKPPAILPNFSEVCTASLGQRLAWGHSLSQNRDTLQVVLMTWLSQAHDMMQSHPTQEQIRKMDLLVENILNLRYNPNSRLHLDQLLLVI